MPNAVQVVLNDQNFIGPRDPKTMGARHEFFPTNDGTFSIHKRTIKSQLARVRADLSATPHKIGVLKVTLREEAFAKSHRPNRALFNADVTPCVGAGDLGELYYFTTLSSLGRVESAAENAEEQSTRRIGTTGTYYAPSNERSDLGAVKSVELTSPESKRRFSAHDASQWLSSPNVIGGYIVELFQLPRVRKLGQSIIPSGYPDAVSDVLSNLSASTRGKILGANGSVVALEIKPVRQISGTATTGTEILSSSSKEVIDTDAETNDRLLRELAQHPLVRRIHLPYRLSLEAGASVPAASHQPLMKKTLTCSPNLPPL